MQSEQQAVFRFDVPDDEDDQETAITEKWELIQEVVKQALLKAGLTDVTIEFED